MEDSEFKRRLQYLYEAIEKGDPNDIKRKSLDVLFTSRCYYEIVFNYLTLEQNGIHFDFGKETIKKGTILYRVRKLDKMFDINDCKEWGPSPYRRENRANKNGEEAMYFNVMADICALETHLKKDEKYALAKYEVMEDIVVGGFIDFKRDNRMFMAGTLLNAFLIAPSRGENNSELFELLDEKYGNVNIDDITGDDIIKNNLELPLKLAVIVRNPDMYYSLTNKICDVLKNYYPEGITYSSCYVPVSTVGIKSNCYNLVLYEKGINKVKFLEAKEYTYNGRPTSTDLIKILFLKKGRT